jgi:hypothetical protein
MDFYHASFTRIGGQGVKDGWQAVNVSPGTPPAVIEKYTAFQNANISADYGEDIVTELQTDNQYVYFTRIKYGLSDSQGRPNMFADSFIFDVKQFSKNPGGVLSIKWHNFNFNFDSGFNPDLSSNLDRLDELGLLNNRENYSRLVKCVYSTLTAREPLFIISENYTEEIIANTMYSIYCALFLPFRKMVTFSTVNTKKTIIFNRHPVQSNCRYFNLHTGETNTRFTDYEFVDEVISNPGTVDFDLSRYGCAESTSLSLYKLAWGEGSTLNPVKRLNELLSAEVPVRDYLDRQILQLFCEIIKNDIPLNDIITEKIANLKTNNDTLGNLCTAYILNKMMTHAQNYYFPEFDCGEYAITPKQSFLGKIVKIFTKEHEN